MKPLVIFVICLTFGLTTPVRADALLDAMLGLYPYNQPSKTEDSYERAETDYSIDSEYGNNSEYYEEDGYGEVFEFEDYHLCQYCDTEIIIMK